MSPGFQSPKLSKSIQVSKQMSYVSRISRKGRHAGEQQVELASSLFSQEESLTEMTTDEFFNVVFNEKYTLRIM